MKERLVRNTAENTGDLDEFLETYAHVPDPQTGPLFTAADRLSPTWGKLQAHLTKALHLLRERNDQPLSETQTAKLRGHIACLKDVIALGDEPETEG